MQKIFTILLLHLSMVTTAFSAVVIQGTRIIFEESAGEAVVQLTNNGANPLLVQMWLDNGDAAKSPEQIETPFALAPPVARIDQAKGQAVRIVKTAADHLPGDRESLFWFNAVEVPPRATDTPQFLQLAFRTRIKFFYRPHGLPMTPAHAYPQVQLRLERTGEQFKVRVSNPTPFHITFRRIDLNDGNASSTSPLLQLRTQQERMVAPFSDLVLDMSGNAGALTPDARFHFSVVNDHGGESQFEQQVQAQN